MMYQPKRKGDISQNVETPNQTPRSGSWSLKVRIDEVQDHRD